MTDPARPTAPAVFRYYDLVLVAFVVILVASNVIGAAKIAIIDLPLLGEFQYGAAILFFPLSYVIGDILTEVYGYARARRAVWAGFGAMLFIAAMSAFVVGLAPAPGWENQGAYEALFGQTPRIIFASVTAFWVGELANAFVMARMKLFTEGRHLWTRTIGSTIVGQAFDSLLFYPLAFYGIWSNEQLLTILVTQFVLKVGWEALLTPVTYWVVGRLKRAEGVDIFDRDTDFTPFSIER